MDVLVMRSKSGMLLANGLGGDMAYAFVLATGTGNCTQQLPLQTERARCAPKLGPRCKFYLIKSCLAEETCLMSALS